MIVGFSIIDALNEEEIEYWEKTTYDGKIVYYSTYANPTPKEGCHIVYIPVGEVAFPVESFDYIDIAQFIIECENLKMQVEAEIRNKNETSDVIQ